jgi:hypothetical protein
MESAKDRMKHYIQREEDISQHQLWSQDGFWEDALMIGLKAQLDMMDPVLWDDLDSDLLKEKVLGKPPPPSVLHLLIATLALHNMIFGQLGTLAFTMHEMGLPELDVGTSSSCSPHRSSLASAPQVEKLILSLSEGAQLGEDQQLELLKSIRSLPPASRSLSLDDPVAERPTAILLFIARGTAATPACHPLPRNRELPPTPEITTTVMTMRTKRARPTSLWLGSSSRRRKRRCMRWGTMAVPSLGQRSRSKARSRKKALVRSRRVRVGG